MELKLFKDIKQSIGKMNCMGSSVGKTIDLHNYSTVVELNNTLHTRNNSSNCDEIPLSQTQPLSSITIISEQAEFDLNGNKLLDYCVESNDTSLCRKYLKSGSNFLVLDKKKRSYLHKAAKHGSLEVCQLLLACTSINVNGKDEDFRLAIHLAAIRGHAFIVQYLHRCGSYFHLKDKLNNTVLDYAIESKNTELIGYVFEKSPSLGKSFGFNVQELLKSQGISMDLNRKLYNDDRGKVSKVLDPVDSIGFHDFSIIQVLGHGSFGKVFLVQKKDSQEYFAMKMIPKEKVYHESLEVYLKAERNIMTLVKNPFIVHLHFSFQTPQFFCLVMDYCQGGTLADILSRERCIPENKAKMYLCEILLGIQALHSQDIIYRDLKPENVLLDELGHIKLSDFGLAKEGVNTELSAASFCGTVAYLAPEILEKKGHGKCVDWYAFGTLMYEMLTGVIPKKEAEKTWLDKIRSNKLRLPKYISPNGRNLLEALLCVDYKNRIGYYGAEQIKEHLFFQDVDWEAVLRKELKMPWVEGKKMESGGLYELDIASTQKDLDGWSFVNN